MVLKPPQFHEEPPTSEDLFSTPETLESGVARTLALAGDIDASDVEVTARGPVIVLTGRVNSVREAERIVDLVAATPGVSSVENGMVVNGRSMDGP